MVDDTSQLTQSYIYILLIGAIEPLQFHAFAKNY